MKAKIREVLDDCIADGLRSGYTQAYKYEDFPCEEGLVGHMEEHIWFEIDRRFDFDQDEVERLRAKKKEIYKDLKGSVDRECEEYTKFIDYWKEFSGCCPLDITDIEMAKHAWEAGIQEGIDRKREWVGLTYDERIEIAHEYRNYDDARGDWFDRDGFARAIEEELKEKNT